MRVILGAEPLLSPLTGIGHYTLQLARGLLNDPQVEELRFFANGTFNELRISASPGLQPSAGSQTSGSSGLASVGGKIRAALAKSSVAVACYQQLMPLLAERRLAACKADYLYHSPNFLLPPFKGPKVVTIHDLSTLLYPHCHPPARVRLVNDGIEHAVRHADHIVTDSEYVRAQVLTKYRVPDSRCTSIPLGADSAFKPRDEQQCLAYLGRHGLTYGKFFFFVSTIEPRKNLLNLLKSFERYSKTETGPLPLVIVGDKGWNSRLEHDLIATLERKGIIRYFGYLPSEDLPILFSAARALLFPSLYEGFGLPVLEAMQSGTAVLTSEASAMAEITGDAAYLVNPTDTDAMASGISRLAKDDVLIHELEQRGAVRARNFSWASCIERTLAVYRSII